METLYCAVDLHSNNGFYGIVEKSGKRVFGKRLPNEIDTVLEVLDAFKEHIETIAVESTYNWYWLVDGLMRILKDDANMFMAKQNLDMIRTLSEKIKMFEKYILPNAEIKPEFQNIMSVPGIGKILGLTIMYETGDIGRFKKAGNYTSYCRCVKAEASSNNKKKGNNNRKNGNKYLSWAFVEAAHKMKQYCPTAQKFYDRKYDKKCGALATKALAAKMTKAVYYILKNQEEFDVKKIFG